MSRPKKPNKLPPNAEAFFAFWTKRPDWRIPSQYPSPEGTALQWWGHEFTRRKPGFAAELRAWLESLPKSEIAMIEPRGNGFNAPNSFHKILEVNPKIDGPRWPALSFRHEGVEVEAEPKNPATMTLVFSLDAPIEPQLKKARATLRSWQEGHLNAGLVVVSDSRHHVVNFPYYLRVLDARAAGATFEEIANHFHSEAPGLKYDAGKARAAHTAALAYVQTRRRALLEETSK